MRKLPAIITAIVVLASCSYRERLYVDLPGTVWSLKKDNVTTWVYFSEADSASLVQFNSETGRSQIAHGVYSCDGHDVLLNFTGVSTYKLTRTFFNLKRASSNDNYVQLAPYAYSTLEGSVWMTPLDNNLRIAYFTSDAECVDLVYANITREDAGIAYGWDAKKCAASRDGSSLTAGKMSATIYKDVLTSGNTGALRIRDAAKEEGTSNLKGTIWTYNNTGSPADIPSAIIFAGKDSFIKVSGMWTTAVSEARVSPFVFEITSGTYSESGGTLTLTTGDKNESCSVVGSSFTLNERTFNKRNY